MPANDAFEVDARGMKCPWPVLRAARALREHSAIIIRADDPQAPTELAALAREQGWTLSGIGADHFRIERGSDASS
ncbi:tRNA 2-thiouridine synthesizing protein A [Sphingobium fontiphilum]|uniref:tRNA 2-thiouridine synthesizing protein A n=1 Tax=Sphingobium fontiphilum TaxID=944425 RepID=A0A7W6DJU8_9SPHN|nr:sulfurtransferase TusA family protein [Sphingobium fontiphilum]MBB3980384.1 tRNA 2-thiouridine synthesizing protein A [Sphingobium fontiphilum]